MHERIAAAAVMAFAAIVGGAGSAQALTITFDAFAINDNQIHDLTPVSGSLSLAGFTFSAQQFTKLEVLGTQEARFAGKVALFNSANTGATTLTRDGGGTFSFISIDVANILSPGADSITFHGLVHGGGTVTQSLTFNSFGHLTTLALDGDFQYLDSLSFDQDPNPQFQVPDLVVTTDAAAAPEPASSALLGTALAGFGMMRRRPRR